MEKGQSKDKVLSSTKEYGESDEYDESDEYKSESDKYDEYEESDEYKALKHWFGSYDDRNHHGYRWYDGNRYRYDDVDDDVDRNVDHRNRWRNDGYGYLHLSFEFGKSENAILDKFIEEKRLKWIPYNKLKNIEYLGKGGFGLIYKAIWSYDNEDIKVVLKCHKSLNEDLNEFLNEYKYHESCLNSDDIIYFYGFTKKPDTLNYMVVMDYANKGNLRENLTEIISNNWNQKLYMLYEIISGLKMIHQKNLIHCDFHDGNILNHTNGSTNKTYISDLGLCQPVKSFLKKYEIYGVMPFIAPEVLRGNPYTPASDIYSFSMIMWEFTSGISPFKNRAHDLQLSISICKGERPEITENTPQCYVELMKKCWNGDPLKRPSSDEVFKIIKKWIYIRYNTKIKDINEELKCNIMEFINAPIKQNNNFTTESHPQAYYTSRLLDFTSKKLNEILVSEDKDLQVSEEVSEIPVSENLDDYIIQNTRSLDIKTNEN